MFVHVCVSYFCTNIIRAFFFYSNLFKDDMIDRKILLTDVLTIYSATITMDLCSRRQNWCHCAIQALFDWQTNVQSSIMEQ